MVLLIWAGRILGDVGESVGSMRRLKRAGGYMVIGDGFLKGEVRADHPVLQRFERLKTVEKKLTKHGDTLIREMMIPEERINDLYSQYINSMRKGEEKCAGAHPEHARLLQEYTDSCEEMCRTMKSAVQSCLWLVRKD
jgi:hypothetical protein